MLYIRRVSDQMSEQTKVLKASLLRECCQRTNEQSTKFWLSRASLQQTILYENVMIFCCWDVTCHSNPRDKQTGKRKRSRQHHVPMRSEIVNVPKAQYCLATKNQSVLLDK